MDGDIPKTQGGGTASASTSTATLHLRPWSPPYPLTSELDPPFPGFVYLHGQGVADRHAAPVAARDAHVALGARRGAHQHVDLCQEFDVIAHLHRTGLGEVLIGIAGEFRT